MWFLFALLVMLFWGIADLFYKKSADQKEAHTHLKTVVAVGLVMGIHAIFILLTNELEYDFKKYSKHSFLITSSSTTTNRI